MSQSAYRPPRVRDILLGVLLFLIILGAFCGLPNIVKRTGNMLLFVPAQLGLVTRARPAEIHTLDLETPSPIALAFPQPGRYAIFTGDQQLLMLTDTMLGEQTRPWLQIHSSTANTPVNISFVERGMRPYDTPHADGRPIFTFIIPQAGDYELVYPTRLGSIDVVPDYTTGKEKTILVAYLLQILVAVLIVGAIYYRRRPTPWEQARLRRESQAQRRKDAEAMWDIIRRHKKETEGKQ